MIEKDLNNRQTKELFLAISTLKNADETQKFLRDLCTISELKAMTERFQVAKRVNKKENYRSINKLTGASTATITRVAHWVHHGMGGYKLVIERS